MMFVNANLNIQFRQTLVKAVLNAMKTATAQENHPQLSVMKMQIYVLNVTRVKTVTLGHVLHQKHVLNASLMTIVHNQTCNVELMMFVNANLNIQFRQTLVKAVLNAMKTATAQENHPQLSVMKMQIYVLNVTQVKTVTLGHVLHQKHAKSKVVPGLAQLMVATVAVITRL